MGYLTFIQLYNDGLHHLEENPTALGKAVLDAIPNCQGSSRPKEVFPCGTQVTVFPSRHASDETLYLSKGNSLTEIHGWNEHFMNLAQRNPDLALEYLATAERLIKEAKQRVKETLRKKKT